MRKGTLYVFTGPSGAGKGTLLGLLREQDDRLFYSISATTRAPRPGETDGVQYYFLTKADFEEKIAQNAFLEHARYVDNYYGTLEAPVNEKLAEGYDVILLDTPAGLGAGVQAALAAADLALLVVTPDAVCVRDGRAAAMLAEDCGAGGIRLIINMVPEKWPKETCYRDLDRVIDETAVQLIGVLPAQAQLAQALAAGVPLPHGSRIQRAFCNIANRICGKEVELLFS